MIRITGFKRAFLMPSNRRPSLYQFYDSTRRYESEHYFVQRFGAFHGIYTAVRIGSNFYDSDGIRKRYIR